MNCRILHSAHVFSLSLSLFLLFSFSLSKSCLDVLQYTVYICLLPPFTLFTHLSHAIISVNSSHSASHPFISLSIYLLVVFSYLSITRTSLSSLPFKFPVNLSALFFSVSIF